MKYALNLAVDYMRLEKAAVPDDVSTLEALYAIIGCDMVEIVHVRDLPDGYVMVVDEEGLLKERPVLNVIGSYLYGTHEHGSPIVGNAVIMKEVSTPEGMELAWLTKAEVDRLESRMEKVWFDAVITMRNYYDSINENDA